MNANKPSIEDIEAFFLTYPVRKKRSRRILTEHEEKLSKILNEPNYDKLEALHQEREIEMHERALVELDDELEACLNAYLRLQQYKVI